MKKDSSVNKALLRKYLNIINFLF